MVWIIRSPKLQLIIAIVSLNINQSIAGQVSFHFFNLFRFVFLLVLSKSLKLIESKANRKNIINILMNLHELKRTVSPFLPLVSFYLYSSIFLCRFLEFFFLHFFALRSFSSFRCDRNPLRFNTFLFIEILFEFDVASLSGIWEFFQV